MARPHFTIPARRAGIHFLLGRLEVLWAMLVKVNPMQGSVYKSP